MQPLICVICDGLPDRPLKQLGNRTPLEVAKTTNLDRIARDGISGMMHPVDIGVRPGSDTAHLAIFGYDPRRYYAGRGPYECAGIGMELQAGDVAFRANIGTVDKDCIVLDRRAGRINSTQPIVDYLGPITIDGVSVHLAPGLGHRMGMVLRGPGLSPNVTEQDPHRTGVPIAAVRPLDGTPAAKQTAAICNEFSRLALERLKYLPLNHERAAAGLPAANAILFRGAGTLPEIPPPFTQRYGLRAAFVAGAPMYRGLAKILGLDVVDFQPHDGVTGKPDSNLEQKVARAVSLLADYDAVFVHIKAADSLAEDGNIEGKIAFIEKIDRAIAPLADTGEWHVAITADHTTSSQLQQHTADPVPVTIKGDGVRTDDVTAFSERACAHGKLGTIRGLHLMRILLDLTGRLPLYGA